MIKFSKYILLASFISLGVVTYSDIASAISFGKISGKEKVTIKFSLDSNVSFDYNGYVLSDDGKQAMDKIITQSKDSLNEAEYSILGYTDKIGSEKNNLLISQKRAEAVADYLKTQGIESIKTIEGKGSLDPVTGDKCNDIKDKKKLIECTSKDRRVEILVKGERYKD